MEDQQAALEQLRELYREKNEHLEKFLEPVEPYEFYREIFPEGSFERKGHFEDRKGNGIAVTVPKGEVDKATGIALQIEGDGKAKRCTITDELDELRRDAFALLRPYDDMSVEDINRFTKDDVVCALEMFNEDYVTCLLYTSRCV